MSVVLKNITLRNFLSIGAVTQAVNFDSKELTLILGENLDLGGDGARNGTGKTTLIQGLSYVLFGSPINQIRKDNLINRTNAKGMMVTLEFSVNGVEYKIERGRRPNVLRFYVNNSLQSKEEKNEAQGENRETQLAIEHAIGMSSDMFKHIVALNTYSEPFLSMKANDQRNVIEQLLGITLLSEKADLIKEKIRLNKDAIQQEEFRNKAVEEANSRVQEQIDALKRRQNLWQKQHDEALSRLVADYDDLSKIDIEAELQAHRDWSVYNEKKKQLDACNALIARQTAWLQKRDADVRVLQTSYDTKSNIDITAELQAHYDLRVYEANKIELATLNKTIAGLEATLTKDKNIVTKLEGEIKTLEENKCYACGQDLHDENHASVLLGKHDLLIIAEGDLAQTQNDLEKNKNSIYVLGEKPATHYATETEAIKHSSELERIQQQIQTKNDEEDPYADQLIGH